MAEHSKIEWTDHTFNPWTGCTKVSPGCDGCYAETWAKRSGTVRWGAGEPRRRTTDANWRLPLKWNAKAEREGRRFRVFCASLADVFDNAVPGQWRADLFTLIMQTPHLDWLLLTKRIGNARTMLDGIAHGNDADVTMLDWLPEMPNVWIGATVVNQEEADRDIPKLLDVPARVRFLSVEPMLGPLKLPRFCACGCNKPLQQAIREAMDSPSALNAEQAAASIKSTLGIDWVICGGESGPHARPMHPDWARSLRDQCQAAGVPFLFKQWGEWLAISQQDDAFNDRLYRSRVKARLHEDQGALDGSYGRTCTVPQGVIHLDGSLHDINEPMNFRVGTGSMQAFKVGKKAAGRLLDGMQHDGFPGQEPVTR